MPPSHRLRTWMPLVAALLLMPQGLHAEDLTAVFNLAKRDLASARYDYLLNLLRLKQAAGTLSETDLAQINAWLQ